MPTPQETIVSYALTTVQRVKDRLVIDNTNFDVLFARLISSVTDFIESQCDIHFKETVYTNEAYSVLNHQKELILKNIPVSEVTSFQYRAGVKSNPCWTDYQIDSWELLPDEGIIYVHGGMVAGINTAQVTYKAGYKIDFANAGTSTHTLPADLSELCERLVIRTFKRRDAEGKESEAFDRSTIKFLTDLTEEDKSIINKYSRVTFR